MKKENQNTIQELRNCVEYCRQQNGKSSCKNCGLDDDMIDAVLAETEQQGREKERERILKLPKYDFSANGVSGDRYIRVEDIKINPTFRP